jgi:hypothetical protein
MDGLLPRIPHRATRRLLAALVAIVVLASLAAAAPARADGGPAARWPVGGATLSTAMRLATEHWGFAPCGGQVALSWSRALGPGVNAQASWANDVDAYLQPSRNTDCTIALSTRPEWDWPMLCSVVVHEVGHLTGHDHVDDEHDLMYYAYVEPDYACATTPEPVETGAPAGAPATPRVRVGAAPKRKPAAKTKKSAAKKAKPKGRKAAARGHR